MRLELIKELCKNRQISIKNLATNVGISEPTLYSCDIIVANDIAMYVCYRFIKKR